MLYGQVPQSRAGELAVASQRLTLESVDRVESVFVKDFGSEFADAGVEPPGLWQKQAEVAWHRGLPIEQVFEGGLGRAIGVVSLLGLVQLLRVAKQHQRAMAQASPETEEPLRPGQQPQIKDSTQ